MQEANNPKGWRKKGNEGTKYALSFKGNNVMNLVSGGKKPEGFQ